MSDKELKYLLAISLLPQIGSVTARKLISYTGSAEAVFAEKKKNLMKIPGIGMILAEHAKNPEVFGKAESEMEFIRKEGILVRTIYDDDYPERLKQCYDAPLLFFFRGLDLFSCSRILSVVGTRNATEYGISVCQQIIRELAERNSDLIIVSGLAYGIDYQAHVSALKSGLKTIAVLAHGLHTIYPYAHRNLAEKIMVNGALMTDFTTMDNPERNNFLKRNRIIAGIADATLVIESAEKGGALITAELASSYNRDVLAVPGRVTDRMSQGCNGLIRNNKASLIGDARDVEYMMGWDKKCGVGKSQQILLFPELSPTEESIVKVLQNENKIGPDIISIRTGLPVSKVTAAILELEFKGIVSVLPGNIYRLNS